MTIYDSLIDEPSYEVHLAILSLLDVMFIMYYDL